MKPYPSMPGESHEECVARLKKAGAYYEHRVEYATTFGSAGGFGVGFQTEAPRVPEGVGWEMIFATSSPDGLGFKLFWFWKRVRRLSQEELGL